MNLTVTVNSPGEVAGWLLPVAAAIKHVRPSARVRVVVTPCAFAGGLERDVSASHWAIDEVVNLRPLASTLLWTRLRGRERPAGGRPVVLHLGGDRAYALLLAKLLRAPAWVYGTSTHWCTAFDRCLVPDARTASKLAAAGVTPDRLHAVGQLTIDSVPPDTDPAAFLRETGIDPVRNEILALLPGSRPYELDFMLPFYGGLADDLATRRPSARCVMPWSGFVPRLAVERALAGSGVFWVERPSPHLVTARGLTIPVVATNRYAAMGAARLAISLPGTNTLQMAALGVPMLVIVPLNRAETIVVEGPLNWLSPRWAPTRALKRAVLFRLNRQLRYVALPNIIAADEVVPEMRAEMTPADLGRRLVEVLDDGDLMHRMRTRLPGIAGPRGAAQRVAALLQEQGGASCDSGS